MNKIFLLILVCMLFGCTREPLVVVEHEQVFVPVKPEVELHIPERPKLKEKQYVDYLIDILEYTTQLETIIKNVNDFYGKQQQDLTN